MERTARTLGIILAGAGLAVLVSFAVAATQNADTFHAALAARREHAANALVDLRFLVASSQFAVLVGGAFAGGLLALNGYTLILIGRLARRLGDE